MFLRVFKHLLPRARAWRLTADKNLRKFFEGLSGLPSDAKDFYGAVFFDIDPTSTRELAAWESQFGLPNTALTTQQRRDRLAAAWQATGGQSPRYIQDILRAAGFNVYVHEWWEPGSNPPVARNPLLVLNDGSTFARYDSCDGADGMQDGDALAQDGGVLDPTGYALVNKTCVPQTLGDGDSEMQDSGALAQDGSGITSYAEKVYVVQSIAATYPFYLYIGGETFPEHATIPANRKNEFETLCLKICPAQQWLGILVDFT